VFFFPSYSANTLTIAHTKQNTFILKFMNCFSSMLYVGSSQASQVVQPIQSIFTPEDCSRKSEDDDHLMIRYSLKSAASTGKMLFYMKPWEQQHYQLGHPDTPTAFTQGLKNMCPGEIRQLTFSASDFDLTKSEADESPVVVSEVELLALTPSGDYYIFDLIEKGDVGAIMEMIDNHGKNLYNYPRLFTKNQSINIHNSFICFFSPQMRLF
jgi:hypothetical protein